MQRAEKGYMDSVGPEHPFTKDAITRRKALEAKMHKDAAPDAAPHKPGEAFGERMAT
jgi:hypothetical protein